MMNEAELYHNTNTVTMRDSLLCLKEYGTIIKWKSSDERVIDIGCGDGRVTNEVLKKFIPPNYKKFVGCDISEEMINFAKQKYSSNDIEFIILNIVEELPNMLRNSFDHVFSIFTLHRIQQQEVAFRNIYDLMADGGACWLLLFGYHTIFDVYRSLARTDKWRHWLRDVEDRIAPYHDCREPEKEIEQMMKKIGFANIRIDIKHSSFSYNNIEVFKESMPALDFFNLPKEVVNDYLEDMVHTMRDMGHIGEADDSRNGADTVTFRYSLLIISGTK